MLMMSTLTGRGAVVWAPTLAYQAKLSAPAAAMAAASRFKERPDEMLLLDVVVIGLE
jgi:hypothetical protein